MRTLPALALLFALATPATADDSDDLLAALAALEGPGSRAIVADIAARAESGELEAQYWYGRYLHDIAPLAARDFTTGRAWLERASERGHIRATRMLARVHEVGFVVPASNDAAERYLERLIALGVTDAAHDIARIAFSREPRDGARILRYLEIAAEGGHVQAVVDLGFLYASGTLGEVDGPKAHHWARRGVDLRQPRSMNLMARLYANGLGVEADAAEALKWAILARDAGDAEAGTLASEIAAAVPEEVQHEARARALAWRDANTR